MSMQDSPKYHQIISSVEELEKKVSFTLCHTLQNWFEEEIFDMVRMIHKLSINVAPLKYELTRYHYSNNKQETQNARRTIKNHLNEIDFAFDMIQEWWFELEAMSDTCRKFYAARNLIRNYIGDTLENDVVEDYYVESF